MSKKEILEQIKTRNDKITNVVRRAIDNNDLSAIEAEIIIDNLKAAYELVIDAAYEIDEDEEPLIADKYDSVLDSIKALDTEVEEPAMQDVQIEQVVVTEKTTTTFTAPINKEIIDSLYGEEPEESGRDNTQKEEQPTDQDPQESSVEIETTSIIFTSETENSQETIVFNETIENNTPNLASVLSSQNTKSLKESIGINDKFLLMRDLFSNDISLYEKTIDKLDSFSDPDDAFIYLQENFTIDPQSEAAKILIPLLERKSGK